MNHYNSDTKGSLQNSQEMKQFRQAHEISARASKFQEQHKKDWIHGIPNVRSLITYSSVPTSENNSRNESYLAPDLTMADVSAWESTRHSSLDTTNNPDAPPRSKEDCSILQSDDFESPFSGLLHVPSFSFTRPDNVKPQIDISQYLLQTHFEVGEITYFFGGLQTESSQALKHLGIPRSTDPSLISVHFPCDMPPFVNKDVLMSPFFVCNPCFFVFNPTRSTVHDFSNSCFEEFEPGHFCDMKGTQISEYQVFFCGGFKINVDKVEFNKEAGRWVVEKSISTNESGYILDVRKLSFTKISLLSRSELNYKGRIGAGICSNFSTRSPPNKTTIFESEPSSHTDGNNVFPKRGFTNVDPKGTASPSTPLSPTSPSYPCPPLSSASSDHHKLAHQSSSMSLSSQSSRATLDTKSVDDSDMLKKQKDVGSMIEAATSVRFGDKGNNESEASQVTEGNLSQSFNFTALKSSESKLTENKGHLQSETKHDIKVDGTPPSHRVPVMVAKSSRFFHRSQPKQQSSVSSSSSAQSSYSHHVKQHRSKSRLNPQVDTKSTLQPECAKFAGIDSNELASAESLSSTGSRSRKDLSMEESSATKFSSPQRDCGASHVVGDVLGPKDSPKGFQNQNVIIYDTETQKSDQKSGISSICVYLFGGFLLNSRDGRQVFTATNDLLKLELIISDNLAFDFHPEALIDTMHPQSDVIPKPRGYFAHILTTGGLPNESCNIFGPECRTSTEVDQSQFPVNISDVLSTDRSINTEKSSQSFLKQEKMHLIVHGGVDDKNIVYGDCFYFSFDNECWVALDTYAFDYYEIPKQPYEDEDSSKLQLETQVENAKLVDAELRSCHHKAIVYWEGDKEYVAFVGGFANDFLRHHDQVPYQSSKFDVSRLAKLSVSSANPNLLRIPVLNLQSQVWKFKRYFYDLTESAKPGFVELLQNSCMRNSRMAMSGGGISIVGKQLTFCHGLVQFVPEKVQDYESMQEALNDSSVLLGGHFHLTFPGM